MAQRVHYIRKHSYNTKSNQVRVVKTPGGRLTVLPRKKISNGVKCGECGCVLAGIKHVRPHEYRWIKKSKRTVTRAYGGARCHKCVQKKILRAFFISEQKLMQRALKQQAKELKAEQQVKAQEEKAKSQKPKKAAKTQKK